MKWISIALLLPLSGCGWAGKEEEDAKPSGTAPKLVGRISSVPDRGGFVLIEGYGRWTVPDGGLLTTAGDRRQATLAASGEKLGQFRAADIRSGSVEPGDLVFHRPLAAPAEAGGATLESMELGEENQKKSSSETTTP